MGSLAYLISECDGNSVDPGFETYKNRVSHGIARISNLGTV